MMRFYIASRLENAARVRELASELESWGWKNTFDWTHVICRDPYSLMGVAAEELAAIICADILIALLPGRQGTYIEAGIALARGDSCKVIFHAEDKSYFNPKSRKTCSFFWLPGVERVCCAWEELPGWLKQKYGAVIKV